MNFPLRLRIVWNAIAISIEWVWPPSVHPHSIQFFFGLNWNRLALNPYNEFKVRCASKTWPDALCTLIFVSTSKTNRFFLLHVNGIKDKSIQIQMIDNGPGCHHQFKLIGIHSGNKYIEFESALDYDRTRLSFSSTNWLRFDQFESKQRIILSTDSYFDWRTAPRSNSNLAWMSHICIIVYVYRFPHHSHKTKPICIWNKRN